MVENLSRVRGCCSGRQELLDVFGDGFGFIFGTIALDDLAFGVDEKLGEVPLDGFGAQEARGLSFEVLVERMGARAIYIDLGMEWKRHTVVDLAEACNLVFAAGFLALELLHGKPRMMN